MPRDADDEEPAPFRSPLPAEDRLWRHPSELARPAAVSAQGPSRPRPHRPVWGIALAAGLVGAVASIGAIAAIGLLDTSTNQPVRGEVALAGATTGPALAGPSTLTDLATDLAPSIVTVEIAAAGAVRRVSGVVVDQAGLVLTTATGLSSDSEFTVWVDGAPRGAELLGLDTLTDIAVIDMGGRGWQTIEVSTSVGAVGADVVMVAAGPSPTDPPTVMPTVVSSMGVAVQGLGNGTMFDMIRTVGALEPAAAGGALVDDHGRLVGVLSGAGGRSAVTLATPTPLALKVAEQIAATGSASHAWLGLDGVDLTTPESRRSGLDGGVEVLSVVVGSPAEGAGIRAGDHILRVEGEDLSSMGGLVDRLRTFSPGDEIELVVVRDGQTVALQVELGLRP